MGRLSQSQHTAEVSFSLPDATTLFAFSLTRTRCLVVFNFALHAYASRDATNKLFSSVVQQRRTEIQANPKISRSLLAFQR